MILKAFWKWLVGAEEPNPPSSAGLNRPLERVLGTDASGFTGVWNVPWNVPESSIAVVNKGGDYDRALGSIRLGITSPIDPGYIDIYGGVSPDSLRAMPTGKLCALKHALLDFDARSKRWKTSEVNSQAAKGVSGKEEEQNTIGT